MSRRWAERRRWVAVNHWLFGLAACVPGEDSPPPDIDTGSVDTGGLPMPLPDLVNDGDGRGLFVAMRWRAPAVVARAIGAPNKGFGSDLQDAGKIVLVGGINDRELSSPADFGFPDTIIERASSAQCPEDHEWAWFAGADRKLGSAFTFYSNAIGISSSEYEHRMVSSAPTAGADSGRVFQYNLCLSCVMFPRTPDSLAQFGDEMGTEFGTSVATGFFAHASSEPGPPWWENASEQLLVGAPAWEAAGGVHVYERAAYLYWREWDLFVAREGKRQCDYIPGVGPGASARWRSATLTGGPPGAEFGRSIAVADFNCDGFDDVAIGAPGAGVPAPGGGLIPEAGAVFVFYGGPGGLGAEGSLVLQQGDFAVGGTPEPGDRFGTTLAVGNFDGGRTDDAARWSCWDLAVGTPDEDEGAGEVQIFTGHPAGLSAVGPVLRLGENGIPGTRTPGDRFGHALMGDRLGTGSFHELVIGAPGDDLSGSVTVVPGSPDGLDPLDALRLVHETPGVDQMSQPGDEFGFAVGRTAHLLDGFDATGLMVGVPGRGDETGMVLVIRLEDEAGLLVPAGSSEIWQADLGGTQNPGDRFGSVLSHRRAFPHVPTTEGAG
jgi:hypothetical protein